MFKVNFIVRSNENLIFSNIETQVGQLYRIQAEQAPGNFDHDCITVMENMLHLIDSVKERLNTLEDFIKDKECEHRV